MPRTPVKAKMIIKVGDVSHVVILAVDDPAVVDAMALARRTIAASGKAAAQELVDGLRGQRDESLTVTVFVLFDGGGK